MLVVNIKCRASPGSPSRGPALHSVALQSAARQSKGP